MNADTNKFSRIGSLPLCKPRIHARSGYTIHAPVLSFQTFRSIVRPNGSTEILIWPPATMERAGHPIHTPQQGKKGIARAITCRTLPAPANAPNGHCTGNRKGYPVARRLRRAFVRAA